MKKKFAVSAIALIIIFAALLLTACSSPVTLLTLNEEYKDTQKGGKVETKSETGSTTTYIGFKTYTFIPPKDGKYTFHLEYGDDNDIFDHSHRIQKINGQLFKSEDVKGLTKSLVISAAKNAADPNNKDVIKLREYNRKVIPHIMWTYTLIAGQSYTYAVTTESSYTPMTYTVKVTKLIP